MNNAEAKIMQLIREGFLSIDAEGRIWRHYQWINYRHGYRRLDIPTRAELENSGYYELDIRSHGESFRVYAHRIVWIYFNGDNLDGLEVNHKNGIRNDNLPDNLEKATEAENTQHAYRTGLAHGRPGEMHHNVKLTQEKVDQMRREHASGGVTHAQLGAKYNISPTQAGKIVNYKRWRTTS